MDEIDGGKLAYDLLGSLIAYACDDNGVVIVIITTALTAKSGGAIDKCNVTAARIYGGGYTANSGWFGRRLRRCGCGSRGTRFGARPTVRTYQQRAS